MNDDNNSTDNNTDQQSIEDAIGTLFDLGRMWASHGLHVAELALDVSAKTLRTTADALGDASARIEKPTEL